MEFTNLADGPPFLGDRPWNVSEFEMLITQGITVHGNVLQETTDEKLLKYMGIANTLATSQDYLHLF